MRQKLQKIRDETERTTEEKVHTHYHTVLIHYFQPPYANALLDYNKRCLLNMVTTVTQVERTTRELERKELLSRQELDKVRAAQEKRRLLKAIR